MNKHLSKRLLSLMLAVVLCVGLVLPAAAAGTSDGAANVTFEKVDNSRVSAKLTSRDPVELPEEDAPYDDSEVVRVSIVLSGTPTLTRMGTAENIAADASAMSYRSNLERVQEIRTKAISNAIGEPLDVVWNLTLAANIISANVEYGQIEAIERVPGVQEVLLETRYEPAVVNTEEAVDPNMATSGKQIGTASAWAAGYTGAGSRIAIIDTGIDPDHMSFDSGAFEYSLSQLEDADSLDLLDAEEIAAAVDNEQLNANVTADRVYLNSKLPYTYNYVDENYNITHLYDTGSEHGSHVAGIAAANAYVPSGDGYAEALEAVAVRGVAPDAQLMVMKVFGENGGAYDTDYMAAIEDAIVLGADSINLSLGSGDPGMSRNSTAKFQQILDSLADTGVVVVMSAGNSGNWAENVETGVPYLYLDDVSLQTNGSPGSYTNSLAVASVDNDGVTGAYFTVDDEMVLYNETYYTNEPLATLAGEKEYVFIDGMGTAEDWAAVGEALKGKIAFCSRGEISFYQKAQFASEAGAIATIIYNNQPGVINMNLEGYTNTAPAVSITQADGAAVKAASTPETDGEGNVLYYTGTITIADGIGSAQYNSDYYTMSDFSSWGVPGSLELKPEITAPGGSIYSVNGAHQDDNGAMIGMDNCSYENMSGTSMAAPQVTGMAALVAEYIRENKLDTQTGLTARQLAQSLLMSTAVPVVDGESGSYYPVIQQGAGLANVGAVVSADSYILMDSNATASYADGKVKAELGDDPEKTGVYSFSFSIYNLTDEERTFALSADVFTQDAFAHNGNLYLDTWTTALMPDVSWTVNGSPVEAGDELAGLDFNGDGLVNTADGQALLDYDTGVREALSNADKADLNSDGSIDTYDAYLFFSMLNTSGVVVPANGSTSVAVTITLSEDDRDRLAYYENGAYIEAFVYAKSLASAEGVEGTTHSIPVLGFYGNWSDASMFDKGSFVEYAYGLENRAPYLYQSAMQRGNYNGLLFNHPVYGNDTYYFGGNPMVDDDVYMPERNAISAEGSISKIGFTAIRNSAASFYQVKNADSGEYYLNASISSKPLASAYYYVNGGAWKNTYYTVNSSFTPDPSEIPEGTKLEVGITLVPEYYVDSENVVHSEKLGSGATFSMPMVVDYTAPELKDVAISLMNNTLNVTVADNQYVSAVALFDIYGQYVYCFEGAKAEIEAGAAATYELPLDEVDGASFLLQVYDYACNVTTYEIHTQIGEVTDTIEGIEISASDVTLQKGTTATLTAVVMPVNAVDRAVTWTSSNEEVATVDDNGLVTAASVGEATITATAVADETKTASCSVTVIDIDADLNGIVWDEDGSIWFSRFNTRTLPAYEKLSGDMLEEDYFVSAAVGADGTLYSSSLNTSNGTGALYTIDPETYEATELADCSVYGIDIFYSDLAYAPMMFGTGALLGTYGPYVIAIDPVTGEGIAIIDEYENELIGIAGCGSMPMGNDLYADFVYVIDNKGIVTQEIYISAIIDGQRVAMAYSDMMEMDRATMETGISKGDAAYFNSAYYDGEYLYWTAFDQDSENSVTLYAIDADYTGNVYSLGQFADGVWPVGGLYQMEPAAADDSETAAKLAEISAAVEGKELQMKDYVLEQIPVEPFSKEKVTATGGLNSVASYTAPVRPLSAADVTDDESTVTLDVTAWNAEGVEIDTKNGLVYVGYNPDSLELVSFVPQTQYSSWKEIPRDEFADANEIVFGYVDLEGIPAGAPIAKVTFKVLNSENPNLVVIHNEANEDTDFSKLEFISVVDQFEHKNTEVRNAKDPTCTEPGYTGDTYCKDCGKLVEEGEEIPALGHDWGEWVETVSPTATEPGYEMRTCKRCSADECREIPAKGEPIPIYPPINPPTLPAGTPSASVKDDMPFVDVKPGDWFYGDVEYVWSNGLMKGVDDTHFGPNGALTRGMIVTILYRMENEPAVRTEGTFSDVALADWFGPAVEWAAKNGIVNGYDNGKFGPNDNITREQLAAILYRYAKYKGYDVSVGEDTNILSYADAESVSEYAIPALQWACGEGLINGADGKLMPTSSATRAQVAAIIHRFLEG